VPLFVRLIAASRTRNTLKLKNSFLPGKIILMV